jgi:membrane-associated phospholipid phosphatase
VGNIGVGAENCDESPTDSLEQFSLPPRIAATGQIAVASAACLTVLLGLAAWLITSIHSGTGLAQLDSPMLEWFLRVRSPDVDAAVTAFTNFNAPMLGVGWVITTILFVVYRKWSVWVLMVMTPILSSNLTNWLKLSIARTRPPFAEAVPPYQPDFSFPSGHTLNSVAITGMLAYLAVWLARQAWVRIGAVLLALGWSVAMSTSRVYLGHHWFTDVLGAWAFGLALLTVLIALHQRVLVWIATHNSRQSTEPSP